MSTFMLASLACTLQTFQLFGGPFERSFDMVLVPKRPVKVGGIIAFVNRPALIR
jgi:hypothetical protein